MKLLRLFLVFAKIGAFTFGGGYAMVPLIERELSDRGWLTASEFANIVAVSQITPGPLALNTATYVGRQVGGLSGALAASFGLAFPAVFITAAAVYLARKGRKLKHSQAAVRGIRGAVTGLIGTAVLFFLETSVLTGLPGSQNPGTVTFYPAACAVFFLALIAAKRFRQTPIRIIGGAALLGLLACLAGWL